MAAAACWRESNSIVVVSYPILMIGTTSIMVNILL
jgi:hypothetical protein